MTWDYGQLWCECNGATNQLDFNLYKCIVCGKVWRLVDDDDDDWNWVEVTAEELEELEEAV